MIFHLNQFGRAFASRAMGADVLRALEGECGSDTNIIIDFEDVRGVSQSFADEFIGALAERSVASGWPTEVAFENLAPQLESVVHTVWQRRIAMANDALVHA